MARRSGFEGFVRAAVRASAAAERERQRKIRDELTHARRLERSARMALAQQTRDERAAEKMAKAQYLVDRQSEVDDLNADLEDRLEQLQGLLQHTLSTDDRIDFDSLRPSGVFEAFRPPPELEPRKPPRVPLVAAPTGLRKLLPGASKRHEAELADAARKHQQEVAEFNQVEAIKRAKLNELKTKYDQARQLFEEDVRRKNAEIDEFQEAYRAKDVSAVVAYNEMVLARSEYPTEGFPQRFRIAYGADSSELAIEYDLPEFGSVPTEAEFRYVKSKDEITTRCVSAA